MESNSGASCPVTFNTAMHRVGAALIAGTVLVVKHTLASRSRAPERAAPLFDFRRPVYSA